MYTYTYMCVDAGFVLDLRGSLWTVKFKRACIMIHDTACFGHTSDQRQHETVKVVLQT